MRLEIVLSLYLLGSLPCKNCDGHVPSKRIIDGRVALKGEFPYQVALVMQNGKGHLCGGAILDEDTILTAAHCFMTMGPWPMLYAIAIGKLVVSWRKDENYYKVKAIRVHPNYHMRPGVIMPDDVAVVKLEKKIIFTDEIKPIELPKTRKDMPKIGTECVIAGFGALPGGLMAQQLMYAEMNIARIGECINFYSTIGSPIPSPHTRLCVNGQRWRNVCSGDAGGPLACKRPDGRLVVDGIVSYGIGCNTPPPSQSPTIFTRVSSFLRWIEQNRLM
ncbi:transmembrane protease serine 9-like [Lineus longissimus]|uniref:transmembrane protease serine 9-like n=1 Tax=Lineus longissimus TaxID=88925 RepID=UPI002B4CC9AF